MPGIMYSQSLPKIETILESCIIIYGACIVTLCITGFLRLRLMRNIRNMTKSKAIGSPSTKAKKARRARAFTCLSAKDYTAFKIGIRGIRSSEQPNRQGNAEKAVTYTREYTHTIVAASNESLFQSRIAAKKQRRIRAYTVITAPIFQNSPKRQRSPSKRAATRRRTQSLTLMAVRKTPILPVRFSVEDIRKPSASTGRKISGTQPVKRARRLSEPYLLSSSGKWRKTSSLVSPGKVFHASNYKRRLSTNGAILPGTNKIKLQELAKDELLASLNEPFDKDVLETDVIDEGKDEVDYVAIEENDKLVQLTELKRVKVIEEIFDTEKKYIFCLDTLDTVFRAPMITRGIAQEKDVNALFPSCLSTIKECHSWFMEQLENRIKSEDWQGSIGDILGKMAGPLKENLLNIYTDYVNSFPKSISTFSKCTRTSTKFRRFIENCYEKSDNLDLPSYLITPVQRLPRYVLLLRQLSKYTRDDHPDNDSIKTALLQMEELIFSLNGSIQSSMQAYTSKDPENRKSIRRQLSRRRKKPRPGSLSLREVKENEDKSEKSQQPNAKDHTTPQIIKDSRLSPDISECETIQEENKENVKRAEKRGSQLGVPNTSQETSPRHQLRSPSPVVLRKNKSENRKSLRRSIGAALSSFWSPKEEKDIKDVHADFKMPASEDRARTPSPSNARRKYGVSYSSITPSVDSNTTPSKSSEDGGIKRRRFSNSFRERTRNFRIQMRRRSGTWFSATEELKESNLEMTYDSPASRPETPPFIVDQEKASDASINSNNNSKSRPGSRGNSLVSLFSKRKPELVSDESETRRKSDSDRRLNIANSPQSHKTLSVAVSDPNFPHRSGRDSKELSICSSTCEETSDVERCGSSSTIEGETVKDAKHDSSNGHAHLPVAVIDAEDKHAEGITKKPKKGKLMKTLRQFMGKGKV